MKGGPCSRSAGIRSPTFASISVHFHSTSSTLPSKIASPPPLAFHLAKSRAVKPVGGETHLHATTGTEQKVRAKMADARKWKRIGSPQVTSLADTLLGHLAA